MSTCSIPPTPSIPMNHSPRRAVLGALSTAVLACATLPAHGAPDAGQLLQQIQTPLPAAQTQPAASLRITRPTAEAVPEGGPMVQVQGFVFEGVSVWPEATLQGLLAPAVGQSLSFADLQRLCARLTQHYRQAGYLLATAYLPAQQIADGRVRITVLEGRLGQVQHKATNLGGQALAPLQALTPGQVLHETGLTETLLALRELPGLQLQSTLRPGQTPGTADLLVDVQPGKALEGDVQLDNAGNYNTGEYRAIASLAFNNPLQIGDQLSLRALASDGQQRYLMAAYQLPVGVSGARVGASVSRMDYHLGKRFADLQASGQSHTSSLYLRQPLYRRLDVQVLALLQLDDKHLGDQVQSTSTETDTRIRVPSLSLQTVWQDDWLGTGASSQISLGLSRGQVRLDATSAALDAAGAQTQQGFRKWSLSGQRAQQLAAAWSLWLTGRAQTSGHNMPSAEKMGLGGAQGVRAYPEGEALGDRGWQGSAELRWQWQPQWTALAFVDAGQVQINAKPWDASANNRRRLAGAGLGAQWREGDWSASMALAWPLGHAAATAAPQRQPRLWLRAGWVF